MRSLVVGALLVASFVAEPVPVRLRYALDRSVLPVERQAVIDAIERGAFADTLIVRDTSSPPGLPRPILDTAGRVRRQTAVIGGKILTFGDSARICLVMYNLLMQPWAASDSTTVPVSKVDSAVSAFGQRIARVIAGRDRSAPKVGCWR